MSRTPRLVLATIALGVVAAAPCAHAQGLPPDPPLTPVADPTRVPVVVESVGRPQLASVVLQSYGTMAPIYSAGVYVGSRSGSVTDFYAMFHASTGGLDAVPLCWTPCTLYGHPGTHAGLYTWVPGVGAGVVDLEVPREGMRLRVRAPSRGGYNAGIYLTTVGGFFALISTGVFVATPFFPSEYLGIMVGAGVGVGVAAAALMIGGIFLITGNNPGVVSTTTLNGAPLPNPREVGPHASLMLTPTALPGGGGLAMLGRF